MNKNEKSQSNELRTPFEPPDIELIKTLKNLDDIQSTTNIPQTEVQKLKNLIIKQIKRPLEHIEPSLQGLKLEDEFKLILLLIADLEQLTPLEQRQIVKSKKYITPDFLVRINLPKDVSEKVKTEGMSFCLEVKKAQKNSLDFNIPLKEFNKLTEYSISYDLPLFFALKFDNEFSNWWYLIPGSVLKSHSSVKKMKIKNRKQMVYRLPLSEAVKIDFSGMFFNNYTVMLPKGVKLSKTYNTKLKEEEGIKFHPERGILISHSIMNETNTLTFDLLNNNDNTFELIVQSSILETLRQGTSEENVRDTHIEVVHTIENTTFFPYYLIVLDCFSYIRGSFRAIFKEEGQSISYHTTRFSNADRNLSNAIQHEIFRLENEGFINIIRMMPYFLIKEVPS
ncbi:MAG: hypothetical protein ACFFC7_17130 [Candidatus Hermodarchaeota archaeon]